MLSGKPRGVGGFLRVGDNIEVFHKGNDRDMTMTFTDGDSENELESITLKWARDTLNLSVEARLHGRVGKVVDTSSWPLTRFEVPGLQPLGDLTNYIETFRELRDSIYLGAFRNAVNIGGQDDYYDLQIGQQFIARWSELKAGNRHEDSRAAIAVQREIQEIFGLDSLEINSGRNDGWLQVIVNDEPFQLQEQGAGFAQFIVVLAFVAVRRPAFTFIDEPELNLHPSLQRDFLTTLARYSTSGVVFATHSIGLARAMGQRAYSVRRLDDETREIRELAATKNYAEFLGELSFSGYSELGARRILLVEGPTEVPVFQVWLRRYGADHNTVILPLGGGSLIRANAGQILADIQRITTSVSVFIDSERSTDAESLAGDRQAFVTECEALGFDIHVTVRRALENYLTDSAVKAVKGDAYSGLGHFDKLADASPSWGKNENWRIAAEMTKEDLAATDIGPFLERVTTLAE